jgi:hypothetical protein
MDLTNNTGSQHFVSQAEQRLNALNPSAPPEKQRIFSFSVTDRESRVIALDGGRGRAIKSNLCLYDLFSFDVKYRHGDRLNFETLFGQYEAGIKENTESLTRKLASGPPYEDVKAEVFNIFISKIMNFLRNPYSVKKVLASFGEIVRYQPTDAGLLQKYDAVIAGKKPQQDYLCSLLGLSAVEYRDWLRALFMLLDRPDSGEANMLERIVKALYENPSNDVLVHAYQYEDEHSDKRCLLSDRGYCVPVSQGPHLAFSFNLCASAFISYVFASIDELAPKNTPPKVLEAYKWRNKTVNVRIIRNDLNALSIYNRNVVRQCHSTVYSSSRTVYGL